MPASQKGDRAAALQSLFTKRGGRLLKTLGDGDFPLLV